MRTVYIILPIVLALIILVFLIIQQVPMIPKEEAERIIITEMGPVEIEDIEHIPDCTICEGGECMIESCWQATVNQEGVKSQVLITGSGEIIIPGGGGGNPSEPTFPPPPPPPPICTVSSITTFPGLIVTTSNDGCDNPTPTCDAVTESCRACGSKADCLRTISYDFSSGEDYTEYVIVGSVFVGTFNTTTSLCTIDDNILTIFSNVTTQAECESLVVSHITCSVFNVCKFI